MSEEVRYSAVGKQYVQCDTFEEFLESDFGKFIEGLLYTIDKDGLLTVMGRNGKVTVRPGQMLFIADDDILSVSDMLGRSYGD